MDWFQLITEVIDLRSFSNLWYWIGLAVVWSTVSHWVLGVPYDIVLRARRRGGQAMEDLEDLARINVNRILQLVRHRFWTQLIGMVAIFVTAMWGMYKNLYVGPFGS